ncbi:hypothetical protein [Martelella mediterranea]|uniref:Tail fiber protein n=1 Tax=Martelella mediterranea TaxID=293089 RepID=A0A4V6P050_9HYPH|nr:hypothetical protein [Martelella mediterranea]TCT29748.1 hypothetical protein EDC90_104820 [Martelella mediterranea]
MTQYENVTIDPTVTNGSQLAANINSWRKAALTLHSGVERPSYASAGTMWINTASSPWKLCVYDGADDVVIGELKPDSHDFVSAGGTDYTNDLMSADNAAEARDKLEAVSKSGDTMGPLVTNGWGLVQHAPDANSGTTGADNYSTLRLRIPRGATSDGDVNGAFADFTMYELVGSYHAARITVKGFGNADWPHWEFRQDGGFYSWGPNAFEAPAQGQPNLKLTGQARSYGTRLHLEERGTSDGPRILFSKPNAGNWAAGIKYGTDGERSNFTLYWGATPNDLGSQRFMIAPSGDTWTNSYGWLHDRFAQAGARVQHDSGVYEIGTVKTTGNNVDCPAGMFVTGLRVQNYDWAVREIYVRAKYARNR